MSKPRAKLSRRKKLVFSLCTVATFFLLLEFALFLAGVRPLYLSRDPFVGFQPGVPLFVRDGDQMRTNPSKTCFFNPQSFPAEKGAGAYRIFCMGGSTTFGHPYDYRTSFSGWLSDFLNEAAPQREWEVINCGGISYASYRECLLMQELVKYAPDLFIICTGHNEFLEDRTYGELRDRHWAVSALNSLVVRTRTGSVMASWVRPGPSPPEKEGNLLKAEVDTILERSVGPTAYHRDEELRQQVVEHCRYSLDRMCAIARSVGARVILVKPAANLRDFTPFKSEHGSLDPGEEKRWEDAIHKARQDKAHGRLEEAVAGFLAAARIDPQHAQGLWEAGDALLAAKRYDEARQHFVRAADEDICPLRATSAIQDAVAQAAEMNGAPLVDFPRLLESNMPRRAESRVLGDESFLDHVHPTIEGHGVLAWALLEQMAVWGVVPPQALTSAVVERVTGKVMARIDRRSHALALVQVIQVLSWAGKNDEALRLTEKAERTCAGLSEVPSYRGRILEKMGRDEEAEVCYREAVRRNPQDSLALARLAFAAMKRNQFVAARAYFATAILCTPESAPLGFRSSLRMGLGVAFTELKQWKEARLEFQAVLRLTPELAEAKTYLDRVEAELAQTPSPGAE